MTAHLLGWGLGDLFARPMPIWDHWYLLILPLCIGVALVYKAIRLDDMRLVPKQAVVIFLWILGGMVLAGAVLAGLVKLVAA